jgi:hypothetical protein
MITVDLLATIARLTGDNTLTDVELFQYVRDAVLWFIGRGHLEFETFVLDDSGLTITPEPTTVQSLLLAYRTAALRLTDIYNTKVDAGEVGRSWRSGLEAESSITLAKSYQDTVKSLEQELETLLLIKNAPETGARFQ